MKFFALFIAGALGCAWGQSVPLTVTAASSDNLEPSGDTVVFTLPGAPAPAAASTPPPALVPEHPKVALPDAFKNDCSLYLQGLIGTWKQPDAQALLGEAVRQRPAFDENKAVNGQIYAFPDPSGRYRELELDFDSDSGTLRTVFAYPKGMTWQECRKLWGDKVNATGAADGRRFYSYVNRKLDVLVDRGGKVISLGLY